MDRAFAEWMNRIAIVLEGDRTTVHRTLQQIQMDGLYSIYDFERIRYTAQTWLDLIDILPTNDKGAIVNLLMLLYDLEQISLDLFMETVENLMQ